MRIPKLLPPAQIIDLLLAFAQLLVLCLGVRQLFSAVGIKLAVLYLAEMSFHGNGVVQIEHRSIRSRIPLLHRTVGKAMRVAVGIYRLAIGRIGLLHTVQLAIRIPALGEPRISVDAVSDMLRSDLLDL